MRHQILGVDFDGTCVEHCYPVVGPDIGAAPYLRGLTANGVRLILWTMRSHKGFKRNQSPLSDAIRWFKENEIPLFSVNKNPDQKSWTSSPKAYCHRYIDDAAHGCPLIGDRGERPYVDWSVVGPELLTWAEIK